MSEPETPGSAVPPDAPARPQVREASAHSAATRPYQAPTQSSRGGYVFAAGLFLFLVGLFWRLVEAETGWITSVWIFASIVMMLVPIAWHAPDYVRAIVSKRGTAFLYVFLTIALGLGIAAFIGWATSGPRKTHLPAIDLTKSARYTLSDESLKLLERVDGTVYATYLTHGQSQDIGLREAALDQLKVYEASSSRVRFAEVDEVRRPDLAARILREQGVMATSSGEDTDVIVLTYAEPGKEVAPGKQKEIKVEPWAFRKTSSTGAEKWLGESVVSSGIYELVFQKYKAYATGGHGERSLSEEFRELKAALVTQNIEVASEPLTLSASAKVPDDCELLMILGPTAPFSPDEAEAVTRWVDKGKALLVTVDLMEDRTPTGLEPLLQRFGVATRSNYEVIAPKVARLNVNQRDVGAVQGMSNQFPVYGEAYADHPAARALRARSGLATFFFKSTYLEIDDKPPAGATPEAVCYAPSAGEYTPVAVRHDKTRTDYTRLVDGVDKTTGKLPLVVTSSRKVEGSENRDARLIVSGDTDIFTDRVIAGFPANLDLARGLVQWGLRREGLVAVSDRTLEDPFVTPTEYQKRFAFFWPLAVVFLPLIFGGMVWWSRRR